MGVPIPLYLKTQGAIANAFVGISMNKTADSSFTLGAFDPSKFLNKTESLETVTWFTINPASTQFGWLHNVAGF